MRAATAPPPARPRASRVRGFTLVEILLAIAVIALATSIIVVNMGGVTVSERIRAAARKLAGMSDFIRSQAAGTKVPCYFDIDFDHNRYRWRVDPPQDTYGRPLDPETREVMSRWEVEEWRQSFLWEDLPRDVYFDKLWHSNRQYYDKDWQWVEYRPDGTVISYVLWIKARDGEQTHSFTIRVNGLTGKSEVLAGEVGLKEARETEFSAVMGSGPTGRR